MRYFLYIFSLITLFPELINAQQYRKLTDQRDGKEYKTVVIGGQEWMAQNINYNTNESWCYKNDPSNCLRYGRLYTYRDAIKACPGGWTLPTEMDWSTLLSFNGYETNELQLKEGGNSGFDAILAGVRYENGTFNYLGEYAYFWSRAGNPKDVAWVYTIGRDLPVVHRIHSFPETGFSVRCIKK